MIRIDITGEQGAGKTWLVENVILPALREAGIAARVADGEPEPGTFYPSKPALGTAYTKKMEVRIVVTNAPLQQPRGKK